MSRLCAARRHKYFTFTVTVCINVSCIFLLQSLQCCVHNGFCDNEPFMCGETTQLANLNSKGRLIACAEEYCQMFECCNRPPESSTRITTCYDYTCGALDETLPDMKPGKE
jgi:hypothetical protein